jgi:hypothetical protein
MLVDKSLIAAVSSPSLFQELSNFPSHIDSTFEASLVYECLTSVPFNAAVATRFLQYYNDTIQFQSTLAYLKNPPASYQQPAVDFVGGLNQLQQQINSGSFANQYVSPHLEICLGSSNSNLSRERFYFLFSSLETCLGSNNSKK